MNTSYYSKSSNNFHAVSVAARAPLFYSGRQYKKLAPKLWFFQKYKKDGDEIFYTEQYQKEVLDKLDPKQVYEDLGPDAVLLCYERPSIFCHRHLIARWLEKHLGIEVKEL